MRQIESALKVFAQSLVLLEDKDPYEAARTRYQWGMALIAAGDNAKGMELLKAAQGVFQHLGAWQDLVAVETILHAKA